MVVEGWGLGNGRDIGQGVQISVIKLSSGELMCSMVIIANNAVSHTRIVTKRVDLKFSPQKKKW